MFIFSHVVTGEGTPLVQFAQSNLQHCINCSLFHFMKKKMTMKLEKVIFREDLSGITASLLLVFVQQKGWVSANPLAAQLVGGTKHEVSLVIRAFFTVRSGPDERQSGVRKTEYPSRDPLVDDASGPGCREGSQEEPRKTIGMVFQRGLVFLQDSHLLQY